MGEAKDFKTLREELGAYTVDEVAKATVLSRETIRRYIRAGKLKAKKVGKQYFLRKTDVEHLFLPD